MFIQKIRAFNVDEIDGRMAKYWSKYCQPQFADRIFTPSLESGLNQPQGLLQLLLLLLFSQFYTQYV